MRTTTYIAGTLAIAVTVGLTACSSDGTAPTTASSTSGAPTDCTPPPEPDTTTVSGWIGYLNRHLDDTSLSVDTGKDDDGKDTRILHRADEKQPLASAVKVVHLAAYAQAVADGRLDANEPIQVADWERWYLPGTDGGAHPHALERLGNPPTVTLDQLVSAMIQESDNAATDYLLDRLGDRALIDVTEAAGWVGFTPSTKLGSMLRLLDSSVTPDTERDAARRYAADPTYRAQFAGKAMPGIERQAEWAQTTDRGSAADVASIHRAIASGEFGAGTDIARRQLEWQPAPPGLAALGFKGGALPGVLTDAIYIRRPDGTVATAVLLNQRMPTDSWSAALQQLSEQQLLVAAMLEPEAAGQLKCAL